MAVVSKLEDENRRLRDQLTRTSDCDHQPSPPETVSITREELQCIKNLTEENVRFKSILKAKEKELARKALDTEAVNRRRNSFLLIFRLISLRFKLNLNVSVN